MIEDNEFEGSLLSDINVTPLVDVMLVLLIIFMITAPLLKEGVNVDLPRVSAKPLPVSENRLFLTITKDKKIYLNGKRLEIKTLREKLYRLLKQRDTTELFLRADKDIPYGFVVKVMSELRKAGVERLGMITRPLETKR